VVVEEEMGERGEDCVVEEEMEDQTDSDYASAAGSQAYDGDLYKLEDIINFLDEIFGQSVNVLEHFPDAHKFMESILKIQKKVGMETLDEKKRYSLKKYMTAIRKHLLEKKGSKKRNTFK